TLHPQIKILRARIGCRRRHHDEPLRPRRLGHASKRQHEVMVDLAERPLAARLLHRGAEAAERDVALHALKLRLELLVLHDAIGETRMLAPDRASRNGEYACEVWCIQQTVEHVSPYESARTGEQGNSGFVGRHGSGNARLFLLL